MKKILTIAIIFLMSFAALAQDSQGKFPIFVLPEAMTDDGSTSLDLSIFDEMVKHTKSLISTYPKSYLVNDINQAKYVVGVFIDSYSREDPKSAYDEKERQTYTLYEVKATYTLAISSADQPDKIISVVGPYSGGGSSMDSYSDADKGLGTYEPKDGRIRELLEDALSLEGQVTKVIPDSKHQDKADHAIVNMGKNKGVIDTQWFDVFELDETGNKGQKPIGTLHAVEVGETETECSVKKGDKDIMAAYNQGKTLVVESREEKNLWKSAGRLKDKIKVFIP